MPLIQGAGQIENTTYVKNDIFIHINIFYNGPGAPGDGISRAGSQ